MENFKPILLNFSEADLRSMAMEKAEFIAHQFLDGINCYDSVYLPILHILRSCSEQAKEAE